jgi:hypothetical protein
LKDKKKQIINDLNDSKKMNEINEIKLIENEMRSKEEIEYVLKDELSEDEKMKEDERNSDSELKN